jgi:hypothetical protein
MGWAPRADAQDYKDLEANAITETIEIIETIEMNERHG